jgi:hypothetical protein
VDVGTIELLVPANHVVARGESVEISFRINLSPGMDIRASVGVSGDPAHTYHLPTTPSLVSVSATSQTFRVVIQTWALPLGNSSFRVSYNNNQTGEWHSGPNFLINVVPTELPEEWNAPTIEFLSVSAPTVIRGDSLTVRWRVTDLSGVEEIYSRYSTTFRALCGPDTGKSLSGLSTGHLVSGTPTNGEFEATYLSPRYSLGDLYLGTCDLNFYATDVWGNWSRHDAINVFVREAETPPTTG